MNVPLQLSWNRTDVLTYAGVSTAPRFGYSDQGEEDLELRVQEADVLPAEDLNQQREFIR